jgi:hypothetical protein
VPSLAKMAKILDNLLAVGVNVSDIATFREGKAV